MYLKYDHSWTRLSRAVVLAMTKREKASYSHEQGDSFMKTIKLLTYKKQRNSFQKTIYEQKQKVP